MDRNSLIRLVLIAAAAILFFKFGMPLITGSHDKPQSASLPVEAYVDAPGFAPDPIDPPAAPDAPKPAPPQLCTIQGNRYQAVLSTHGAGLTHLFVQDAKYASGGKGFDLSTTPDVERWHNLRTQFRGHDANSQLKYDRFDWKLDKSTDKSCAFSYEDADVRIVKTITAGADPFELFVDTSVTNLADQPKRHQFSISAASYHINKDLKGSLGRQSPFDTVLECSHGKDVTRKKKDDFKTGWFDVASTDRYGAVNSHYFVQALVPLQREGGVTDLPQCELLAEEWISAGQTKDSDDAGYVFHARMVYPAHELAPHATVTYHDGAFFGPKERGVLAKAFDGKPHLNDVIDLGFFTPVARVLVDVLVFIRNHITFGNWGVAIIVMTVILRTLLFPLTFRSIKTTVAMRKLKPEVDALNQKFKDDAQAKNLAMMELWKKHGVNPLGGCLPQVVQMPIWWAMYTTLQTAVELYHVKFLWFADLSAPDKFYVLPILLGAFMIIQQRIVPQQGMDPMQQKMMMWLLPGVFTVMMLFLPAALGVYMLTNSLLAIGQQLVVERIAPRSLDGGKGVVVASKRDKGGKGDGDEADPKAKGALGMGKGKARV
jgi:YidC/Oxa1 family membrane protein insertase